MKDLNLPHDINIAEGLFGFEDFTKWTLEESKAEPFLLLKSCDCETLEFILVDPFLVCQDYEIDIDDSALDKIGIKTPSDIFVLTIITIGATAENTTCNLAGPLIINRRTGQAMQAVIGDARWSTKFNLLNALKQEA